MSRTNRRTNNRKGRTRHISVRAVRRATPDIHRLGRAIVSLALAEAETQARKDRQEPSSQPSEGGDRASTEARHD